MPEAASHFLTWDWIVHSVHPLDLPGKLDTFYLAYDVLQVRALYTWAHLDYRKKFQNGKVAMVIISRYGIRPLSP